jgi:prepilin-type processing-associated H-X9-DG protein
MMAEANWFYINNGAGLLKKNNFWAAHNDKGNILFTDGHVAASKKDTTSETDPSTWFVWSYYYDNAWN